MVSPADVWRLQAAPGGVQRFLSEGVRYPDPIAERITNRICEAEIIQVIGIGRGANRTADRPLEAIIPSDAVVPVPVDRFGAPEDALDRAFSAKSSTRSSNAKVLTDGMFENPAHLTQTFLLLKRCMTDLSVHGFGEVFCPSGSMLSQPRLTLTRYAQPRRSAINVMPTIDG